MSYILKNGIIHFNNKFINQDVLIDDKGNISIADNIDIDVDEILDISGCHVFSGFINILSDEINYKGGYTNIFKKEDKFLKEFNNILASFNTNDAYTYISNNNPIENSVIYGKLTNQTLSMYNKEKDISLAIDVNEVNFQTLSEFINKNIVEILYSKNNLQYIFSILYTNLVKNDLITLEKLLDLISYNIGDIFGFNIGYIKNFSKANITIFDLNKSYKFNNTYLYGKCLLTIKDGKIIYRDCSI